MNQWNSASLGDYKRGLCGTYKSVIVASKSLSDSKRNILYLDLRGVYVWEGESVWKPVENWWSQEMNQWNYNCFLESIQKGPE